MGFYGVLGRANAHVILKDKGGKGDDIPNMETAMNIVVANPLPEPIVPPRPPAVRSRGRPTKRRRRNKYNEL